MQCLQRMMPALRVAAAWLVSATFALAAPPDADTLRHQAASCRELLESSVLNFYLPAVDTTNGGYMETMGPDGKFTPAAGKFLTLQGRQLWFFSTLAENGIRKEETLPAAAQGFKFLQEHFLDQAHGGYFSRVSAAGEPADRTKHAYLNSFALYGICAYARASKDPAALEAAKKLFQVLEEKAHDAEFGGYVESFTEDWQPLAEGRGKSYVGAVGSKTYNSHLHLLESFTELQRTAPDAQVAQRMEELLKINTVTVRHPEHFCNIDAWDRQWKIWPGQNNLRASYGHDVECVWLVYDSARTLKHPDSNLKEWAVHLVDYSLKHGFDEEHGGFYYAGPLGGPAQDKHKEWWVQAEALVSMLTMYQLTGDEKYYTAFNKTFDFVKKHQIAQDGGWWAARSADGGPDRNRSRTSMWQGAYHSGRALLVCSQLLERLAASKPTL